MCLCSCQCMCSSAPKNSQRCEWCRRDYRPGLAEFTTLFTDQRPSSAITFFFFFFKAVTCRAARSATLRRQVTALKNGLLDWLPSSPAVARPDECVLCNVDQVNPRFQGCSPMCFGAKAVGKRWFCLFFFFFVSNAST